MKTTRLYRRIFPAVLGLMLVGCDSNDDRSAADFAVPVAVERVRLMPISDFVAATGTLQSQREERLITEVAGVLNIVNTNGRASASGIAVEAGRILAEIENKEWLLEVRVESQIMAMKNAENELEKQTALFEQGGVTEKELEIARQSALDARLNYEAAQLKANKLVIKAPMSGILSGLKTNFNGTYVNSNFHLATISDYDRVTLSANLPNNDIGRIQIGQPVRITNYAIDNEVFMGQVVAIDPTIDPVTRTFAVRIVADNPDHRLRPGMFVKAEIIVAHKESAVVIPKDALQTRENRTVVFVVSGVSAEMREITSGIATKEDIEILVGLNEGDRLVIKGHETLRDKSKVRVTE